MSSQGCFCCIEAHKNQTCKTFKVIVLEERLKKTRWKGLYYSFLRGCHTVSDCFSVKFRTCEANTTPLFSKKDNELMTAAGEQTQQVLATTPVMPPWNMLLSTARIPVQSQEKISCIVELPLTLGQQLVVPQKHVFKLLYFPKSETLRRSIAHESEVQVKSPAKVDKPVIVDQTQIRTLLSSW